VQAHNHYYLRPDLLASHYGSLRLSRPVLLAAPLAPAGSWQYRNFVACR
jgi:hypothetical protein